MTNPVYWILKSFAVPTEHLVGLLLRSPRFHNGVRFVHRHVEDLRHGRNPNEPLRQGEASMEPGRATNFLKYFTEELRNQFRGNPTTNVPPPPKAPRTKH